MSQKRSKKKMDEDAQSTLILGIVIGIAVLVGGVILANNAYQSYKKQKALELQQARVSEDPISVGGVYTALNKERTKAGASPLSVEPNLTTAADQFCADMKASNYFDYKNPTSGKDANSFITDNIGDLYLKDYVTSISSGDSKSQTASDVMKMTLKNQATNINNPIYNSVGIAVCNDSGNEDTMLVTAMLANKQEKPAAPVNNYYRAPTTYTPPAYVPPARTSVSCSSYFISSTMYTNCY